MIGFVFYTVVLVIVFTVILIFLLCVFYHILECDILLMYLFLPYRVKKWHNKTFQSLYEQEVLIFSIEKYWCVIYGNKSFVEIK